MNGIHVPSPVKSAEDDERSIAMGLHVTISINKMKLCILCLYRAPDGDLKQFIGQLDSTLLI
jgi:hypothetical protein